MKKLIVVVPGIFAFMKHWLPLKQRLQKEPELAGSTWLEWHHHAWRKRPETYAIDLRAAIDNVWRTKGPFDEITLVGHSFGGVLVRQAYLLGSGIFEDYQHKDKWCIHVRRFVLFASINRGWNPENLHALRFLYVALRPFGPLIQLHKELEVGSDFIADLRIQWIKHFRKLGDDAPAVVQVLGTKDGIVSRADSIDVIQFPNAEEIEIPGANHLNLHRFDRSADQESHYKLIRSAFLDTFETKPAPAKKMVTHVVFLLHGIRANNSEWVEQARGHIEESHPNAEIVTASYGYLPAVDFVIPVLRKRKINWFKDAYSYYYARYPDADFRFLGHSNGTYLLGRSLQRVSGMCFRRVILVGSVLPRTYDWQKVFARSQVELLRNDRANRDFPVGILCSALRGLGMRDVGSAGFHGFDFKDERTLEVFYHDGGHSKALTETNIGPLIRSLMTDQINRSQDRELQKNKPNPRFAFLSRFAPYVSFGVASSIAFGTAYCLYSKWESLTSAIVSLSPTALLFSLGAILIVGLIRAI
ncbi:lipase family alpha/beta hydrolase [Bradyrhizobium sp. SZCCHNR1015]|uniref:lipase family alpha/beta hydrolase n=1 Tax=Bradyrhizobium sp. SZCCHNR1015 TaxID=3057338 RepID=UPI002916E9E9|nr:alpha/beta fold hydrolase [Bradyrhizobium sp. SZCCHNR1015]